MVGVVPDCPPAGSRITAATSPRLSKPSTALMSLGGAEQELIEDLRGHARRHGHVEGRVHRGHDAVMPAVEMAVELHHLRMPRVGARDAQGEVRRLGARHGEAHHLRGGHQLADELGPADLQLVAGAEMRAPRRLLLDRLDHRGVAVPEEERAVTHPVVHVLVAVHVPLARALRAIHVDGKRLEVTAVVRDAAGE